MIIQQKKSNTFGMFFACLLVFALFCAVVVVDMEPFVDGRTEVVEFWIMRVLCILCLPFVWAAMVYSFKELLSKLPLLEITDVALVDRSSAISLGTIYFRDMKRAYIKGGFLLIELKDPESYLQKVGFFKGLMAKANKKLGFDYVCITTQRFQKQAPDFFKALSEKIVISFK